MNISFTVELTSLNFFSFPLSRAETSKSSHCPEHIINWRWWRLTFREEKIFTNLQILPWYHVSRAWAYLMFFKRLACFLNAKQFKATARLLKVSPRAIILAMGWFFRVNNRWIMNEAATQAGNSTGMSSRLLARTNSYLTGYSLSQGHEVRATFHSTSGALKRSKRERKLRQI